MDREKLMAAGIDYDQGVARFAGRAALYEKYLLKLFDDNAMATLAKQLRADNHQAAFETIHDLKGVVGNLSINDLYKAICALVEALRAGEIGENVTQLYQQALALYKKAETAAREG